MKALTKLSILFLTTAINVRSECTTKASSLELYILQDFTSSFKNYIKTTKNLIPQVTTALEKEFASFKVGMGFFGDKPTKKGPDDVCFESLVELTTDVEAFNKEVKAYSGKTVWGNDNPEDSLEVMAYAAGSAAGFTPGNVTALRRVMFLITDVSGHYGPDDKTGNEYFSSKLPLNENLGTELMCETATYPTLEQVKQVVQEAQVYPIVLVVESAQKWWTNILHKSLGYTDKTSIVKPITMDAKDLVKTMTETLLTLECQIQEVEEATTTLPPPETTVEPTSSTTEETTPEIIEDTTPEPTEAIDETTESAIAVLPPVTPEKPVPTSLPSSSTTTETNLAASEAITTDVAPVTTVASGGGKTAAIAAGSACGGLAAVAGLAYVAYAGGLGANPVMEVEMDATDHPAETEERDTFTKMTSEDYDA